MLYGDVYADGRVIDDGIASLFRAPHSYTGEDTVEISCHGGILITESVLTAILTAGAVQAGPGEFTKRAFVNGKLSLSEAEGVINLIDAETKDKMYLARSHTSGVFSREIDRIYENLLALVSQTYVYADYPDEDLTDLSVTELGDGIQKSLADVEALLATYKAGHAISDGIYTVVAGKPNTGKSSLMNALLGRERAIVSSYAGTTRDYLEEKATIGKIFLKLVDTAGIHEAEDEVEKIGISRSVSALEKAELVLAVFDASISPTEEDIAFLNKLKTLLVPKIAILNKNDLDTDHTGDYLTYLGESFTKVLSLSAKHGKGIDDLKNTIESLFVNGEIDYDNNAIVANARQNASLLQTADHLKRAISALDNGFTQDIAGMDIENAMATLAETDGRNVTTDIVDRIFHTFCVGK
ncbi:MAG: tRNA uridine-5-carboxymethylaminomethyl(34) synthesis GTPase MnmE, partial [Clostridia bacterium]|nr:tRNA uridine-5-carboxymethylaminomethyl(34) synthesis GTPase MnmE [Clostridia bacterium]